MFKFLLVLVAIVSVVAFSPSTFSRKSAVALQMHSENQFSINKFLGAAVVGLALTGVNVVPANAEGAISASTIYRARTNYGAKILDLKDAVQKGDFDAVAAKKNSFDLFISQSNYPSIKGKETASAETALKNDLFAAVSSKDAGKLKSAYESFIKVASLNPDFKPDEKGQTDSSGYSPLSRTSRQYIYIR